ncbi:membrane protein insertase, YidC/Oxa1 family [Paenibacillus curdlanolyticus YK9]|uniref:Membrane protein insertase YidC n=1 Tax=Paenibacillus curdlanolyticus YK9 TaxID=717606 RepID=E0I987_9BACL|nr:YidC/Oxa1 family membrane protein insertase [Paenibacillus curdlanolyticus]EFM10971.1 membrane protein insertase, YidC/Oxa1 family [Paenibacillus curdlanolyticus YK9]
MLSRILKQRWLLVLGLVLLMATLTGCSSHNQTMTTEDLLQGNFWQKNVVYWFALVLDTFAKWFGGEYGLSILLLTIIVRTLILPLTLKQYRSSKAMQAIQPELEQLRKKHKDNPQLLQQETMKLFQQNSVNPMAGCLPMIVQMPVFIALYNAIYMNSAIREHQFLWLELGQKDPYHILPIIAAITTFVQTKMMQSQQKTTMPGMQAMLLIFPVMIFVMALSFPAALPLYWIFSNLYTIVQNYFLYVRPSKRKESVPAK